MHGELSRALLRPQLTAPAVGRARFAFRRQVWYTDGMKRLHKKLDFPFRRALAVLLAAAMTFALAGYDAAVYGNRWQGYYDYDFAQLKDYAFWVSAPGTADDFYYAHDFWQYSYDGTVPGVSGSVDRDLWFVPITT